MSMRDPGDDQAYKQRLDRVLVGGARPLQRPIEICEYDPRWPALYEREAERVRRLLGGRVVRVEHAGSTSVPGLAAKPIIDMVLEVPDSSDEAAYVPELEAAGYRLTIREPDWYEHRKLERPEATINLHVFSAGCEETDRMLTFRDWLRINDADRDLYAQTKRELASRRWTYLQQYADAETTIISEIMNRALADEHGTPTR